MHSLAYITKSFLSSFFSKIGLGLFLLFLTTNSLFGQTFYRTSKIDYASTDAFNFSCKSLYHISDHTHISEIKGLYPGIPTKDIKSSRILHINTPSKFYQIGVNGKETTTLGVSGDNHDTIALGPNFRHNGTLVMYAWDYTHYSRQIDYVVANQTQAANATSFSFNQFRNQSINQDGWSGGEVNQKTGEIYFMGFNQYQINNTNTLRERAQIMIYDPVTTKVYHSGTLQRASSKDPDLSNAYMQSDMAIDAEGNAYILVHIGGREARDVRLLRVLVDRNGTNWKYNQIKKFTSSRGAQTWSMAFLNGMLYYCKNYILMEFNPLTGIERDTGFNLATYNGNNFDFASCQMAIVIRGKIYDSDKPRGSSDDGIDDVTVQIYDSSGRYLGEQQTSGNGEYSLLLPSSNTTFYIRVKQPQTYDTDQSKRVNIHQTWASGGSYTWSGTGGTKGTNTVLPVCYNNLLFANKQNIVPTTPGTFTGDFYDSYEVPCSGANPNGIDQYSTDAAASISQANYYTKVVMTTDMAVVHANFGFGLGDRADAPESYKEVPHVVKKDAIYLGNDVDRDITSLHSDKADRDNFDDGILVKNANNKTEEFRSPQGYQFENKQTYTFRVYPNSTVDGSTGYLHGWMSLGKSANVNISSNFDDGHKITDGATIAVGVKANGDLDETLVGLPNGIPLTVGIQPTTGELFYDFNYTIPNKNISYKDDTLGNKSQAYLRFRFLTNDVAGLSASSPPVNSPASASQPWVAVGEVEDYNIIYFFNHIPPLVGDVTIRNLSDDNPLYSRVAGSSFNARVVYLDESGASTTPPYSDLKADIYFVPNGKGSDVLIREGFGVNNEKNEITITLDSATKEGYFKVVYYLGSNTANKIESETTKFGVRPDRFDINVGTNSLIGGKKETITITASKAGSTSSKTYGYDQTYSVISSDTELQLGVCNDRLVESQFSIGGQFKDGELKDEVTYNNVGELNIKLTDSNWLSADESSQKCTAGSSAIGTNSGKSGCDIVSSEKTLKFVPEKFKGDLTLDNDGRSFTYISSNTEANEAMYAVANVDITALLYGGKAATNYHKDCYAQDVNWTLKLNSVGMQDNKGNWVDGWTREDKTAVNAVSFYQIDDTKASTAGGKTSETKVKTNSDNFNDGIAKNLQVGFNFERVHNTPQNPFKVNVTNLDITEIKDTTTSGSRVFNTIDSSVPFIYGRVFEQNLSAPSPITANLKFEGYCDVGCNVVNYPLYSTLKTGSNWYRVPHNSVSYGNVTLLDPKVGDITINPKDITTMANGAGNTSLGHDNAPAPYFDTIIVNTQSWLWHNNVSPTAKYNQFKVDFTGSGGGWAGVGKVSTDNVTNVDNTTGRVISSGASNGTRSPMSW
jgi:hypothetical protein